MSDWTHEYNDAVELEARGLRPNARGRVYINCPACEERVGKVDRRRKVVVFANTGWWRCYRCQARGRLPGDWGDAPEPEDEGWEDVEAAWEQPSSYWALSRPDRALEPARAYLRSRGVTPEVWEAAAVGYGTEGREAGCLIFPAFGADGLQIGWVARPVDPNARGPRYRTAGGMDRMTRLYNEPALLMPAVALVEGPMDALAQWPRGAGFLGKPTPQQLRRVASLVRPDATVVLVLDGDAAEETRANLYALTPISRPRIVTVRLPAEEDPSSIAADVRRAIDLAASRGVCVSIE